MLLPLFENLKKVNNAFKVTAIIVTLILQKYRDIHAHLFTTYCIFHNTLIPL